VKTDLEITPAELRPHPARLPSQPPSLSELGSILIELQSINRCVHSLSPRVREDVILIELRSINHMMTSLIPRVRAAMNSAIDAAAAVKMKDILAFTASHFGMSEMTILSPRRDRKIVRPRQVAMFLCKELTPRAYTEIALFFRDCDHTTVLHAVRIIEGLLKAQDPYVLNAVDMISKRIKETKQ
jgi:chromosomal replication initiation ATPase DnaA